SVCFFVATAPPAPYTLSLHDALPISLVVAGMIGSLGGGGETGSRGACSGSRGSGRVGAGGWVWTLAVSGCASTWPSSAAAITSRSEEHTSELQSRENLVCRLLLEKKK